MDTKKITFYLLIFLLFCVLTNSSIYISSNLNLNKDIIILLFAILFTGLIYALNIINSKDNKDNFHFELTPEKHCEGGAYMHSSASPEQKKFCSRFTEAQKNEFSCNPGFHGRPVHWERTDMSDSKWENKMCDGNFKEYTDPQVL